MAGLFPGGFLCGRERAGLASGLSAQPLTRIPVRVEENSPSGFSDPVAPAHAWAHLSAWGSADSCCVHLPYTAQGCSLLEESSHAHVDTPWWQDHLPQQTRRSQRTDGRRECWVEGSSVRSACSQTPDPSPHGASLGLQVSRTITLFIRV